MAFRLRIPLALVLFLALPVAARADRIDDLVRAEMKKQGIPGLSLAIVKEGKVVKARGYGLANIEHRVPVTPETVFVAPGASAPFTATAILLLAEEGRLKLDDPAGKYLTGASDSIKSLTLRHLLTQTSGLKDFLSDKLLAAKQDFTPEQAVGLIGAAKPRFSPGEFPILNNTNELLLRAVARKASGKTCVQFLQERVFTPLGMKSTQPVSAEKIVPKRASGYRGRDGQMNGEYKSPSVLDYSGEDIGTTARDLALFDIALAEGKALPPAVRDLMLPPVTLKNGAAFPYGIGWNRAIWRGHPLLWAAAGSSNGYTSFQGRYPQDRLSIIVLTNLADADPGNVARAIAAALHPDFRPVALPKPRKNSKTPPDTLDAEILKEMQKQRIPGLTLAVVQDGKVIKSEGYGFAVAETQTPATPETVFRLASVSKQFTAAGILLLMEEGKVALDAPISKYLPGTPDAWKGITVRHLLTMSSGLIRDSPWDERLNPTDAEIFHATAQYPLQFQPDERFFYCNSNYFLLGQIIEKVSGKHYSRFLQERIFQPLGMARTEVFRPDSTLPNRAVGYADEGGVFPNSIPFGWPQASGGMVSTALDLVKWDAALRDGTLLKPDTLKLAWTADRLKNKQQSPYGFGWFLSDARGHRHVEHGGYLYGFRSQISRFIGDRLTVIVLINSTIGDPYSIAQQVAQHYLPALQPLSKWKAQADPHPDRTAQIRSLFHVLAEGKKDSPLAAPEWKPLLTEESLSWFVSNLKELREVTFIAEEEVAGRHIERNGLAVHRVCHVRSQTPQKTWYHTLYFNAAGKVVSVLTSPE